MLSRERMQKRFIEMVKIYSPSGGEKEQCSWIMNFFKEKHINASMDQAGAAYGGNGGNILAHIEGAPTDLPLCFVAHLDQIEPCLDVKPVVDGSIICTDKTTTLGGDDKAAAAAILEIVEDILEEDKSHKEFYILFTVSEETGMQGVKNIDPDWIPCKNMVIADAVGPANIIAYKAPAMKTIKCTVGGRSAHAGIEPEKGINAIIVAAKALSRMHIGRIDEETTANIGRIEGGGATNVVTDEVTFTAEIRSHSMEKLTAEQSHMESCLREAAEETGAVFQMKHELAYPSFELSLEGELYRLTAQAMEEEGVEPMPMVIGGGSDGNILSDYGCDSVILGIGMRDVHTLNETLDMDELWTAVKIMRRMIAG